jgi:polyphenol oxidase
VTAPAPFYAWEQDHFAVDLDGARAVFTTRRGGFSEGPYESLNLGRLTEDDPVAVTRNRGLLQDRAGVRLAHIRQVHGTAVRRIERAGDVHDWSGTPRDLPEFDGQATAVAGVAPMVLTADCLPVAVAGGGAVAMLHAGWRGLAGGIIDAGVRAVRELGGGGPLQAAIGPGAGRCCYEVGEEVHEEFAAYAPLARHGQNLDLKAVAGEKLREAGVELVYDIGLRTIYSDRSLLFSHRRDHGITGRQAGIAWLNR